MEAFLSDFPSHLPLFPWLQSQRILLFEFRYLITVLDEVDEVNELPLKLQKALKKSRKWLSVQYLFHDLWWKLSPGKRRKCLQKFHKMNVKTTAGRKQRWLVLCELKWPNVESMYYVMLEFHYMCVLHYKSVRN